MLNLESTANFFTIFVQWTSFSPQKYLNQANQRIDKLQLSSL